MSYIKMLDEKALQKIFKNSFRIVFNNRTKIITDGFFVVKNYSHVKFSVDVLSALFPKIKDIRGEYKNFNSLLKKPEPLCYEKTCIIVEVEKEKKQCRIYKSTNDDRIIIIDDKYTQYFPLYLYAYKRICFNEENREKSNFMTVGLPYYDTLTEAVENNFLKS